MRIKVVVLVGLTALATACPSSHPPKVGPSASRLPTGTLADGAPSTYLAIEYNRDPARILQLRASTDGHLIRELYRTVSPDLLSAIRAPDGTTYIFTFDGQAETTLMSKLDLSAATLKVVRTFPQEIENPTFDRTGEKLAYTTYPPSYHPTPGLAAFLPYELDVLDLKTGSKVSTTTETGGHPFFSVVWSPDGTEIAATYAGDTHAVLIFDAAHPSFRAARRIPAPRGCTLSVSGWTTSGLLGSETCGNSPLLLPKALVEYTPRGRITLAWSLPGCADAASAITNAAVDPVLVFVRTGYGNDRPCNHDNGHYVYELSRGKLRLISKRIDRLERYLHDGTPVAW